MTERVVVIGRNYTSRLGMIRAVGMAGYEVIVIKTNGTSEGKDIDAYSKYVKEYLYAREPDREGLLKVLVSLKRVNSKTVIIPVDDYAASTIDENIELLKADFLFPNINMKQGAINCLMDKYYQKQLARKAGLNVAEGWVVNIEHHQYSLPNDVEYPIFPKPQISFKGDKKCMRQCNNEAELRFVLDEVARQRDCPMLLEKYIEIDKEYGVLGFCSRDRIITPGLIEKKFIGVGGHKGVTKVGLVTPLMEKEDLHRKIHRFLKLIGFTGLCDIDLYEHKGQLYFNELNLRFGAFGYSIFCAGINMPKLLVDHLLNKPFGEVSGDIRARTVCISEKVNFDDYFCGYYGKDEYNRIDNISPYSFIRCKEDPLPYQVFLSQNFSIKKQLEREKRRIKQKVRNLIIRN